MSGYHVFSGFILEPKNGESLRSFIDNDCWQRAKKIQIGIENRPEEEQFLSWPDYALVAAMPVNLCVYVSNYSVEKRGMNAPPIVADRMGGKIVCDDEYSFYGTYGDWLFHISSTQYDWLGDLEYPDWEICDPDLISFDNYDYAIGFDDDEAIE